MDRNATPEQLELQRRSQDRILVHNPTDKDHIERWDRSFTNVAYTIPNKDKDNGRGLGNAVIPRYIAENYVRHMMDEILGGKLYDAIRQRNKELKEKGEAQMTKYMGGDEETYVFSLLSTKQQDMRDLIPTLWVRVDEEYGMNTEEMAEIEKPEIKDPYEFMYSVLNESATKPQQVDQIVSQPTEEISLPQAQLDAAKDDIVAQVS